MDEPITEAQLRTLVNNSPLPEETLAKLTKYQAIEIISEMYDNGYSRKQVIGIGLSEKADKFWAKVSRMGGLND